VIAACTPATVVSRSSVMSLIITVMLEPAKLQMNWASASGARNLRRETAEPHRGGVISHVAGTPKRPPIAGTVPRCSTKPIMWIAPG
jgi:hypothetical protein